MTSNLPSSPVDSRLALDTLIRRELKVGDPSDPAHVARALMERYQASSRAQAIEGEARGLPFLHTPIVREAGGPVQTAIDLDLDQARDRIRADLQSLLTDNLTQTMRPELEGWQGAITLALDEAVANARLGLDPARRDVAFAMRRQLGEYARLSRLVGLFSPALQPLYRSLAASLDDMASVVLVLIGEAMANVGFTGGRFLLQTSYSDLQARRDAVLVALRQIDGLAAQQGSGSHWPRGLRAHRQINLLLEARGQGELRALLSESELARTLDELVQLASGGTPYGLRSLGGTAWGPLTRLRRFVRTVGALVDPASHELAALLEAMQLFIDGFTPAGGFRLLRVARPALLAQTAGGLNDEQPADRRLQALTLLRSSLAVRIEGWQACRCDLQTLQVQAALDRVLFDLDRAIDAYANGSYELGLSEVRASAAHLLTLSLLADQWQVGTSVGNFWIGLPQLPDWVGRLRNGPEADGLRQDLGTLTRLLRPTRNATDGHHWSAAHVDRYDEAFDNNLVIEGDNAPPLFFGQILHDEVANGLDADLQWRPIVLQLATRGEFVEEVLGAGRGLVAWQEQVLQVIQTVSGVPASVVLPAAQVPQHFEISLQRLAQP